MKIRVIGTGAIFSKYNSASYLIDGNILLDAPNGSFKALKKMDIDPIVIEDYLITHFHGDHYFDMPFYLLRKLNHNQNDISNIYCDEEGNEKIKAVLSLAFTTAGPKIFAQTQVNFINSTNFKVKDYAIEKVLVEHGNVKPAYGYIFSSNNLNVGFTGDANYTSQIDYMASKCNHLICDCTKLVGDSKHMGIDNIIQLANNYPNCIFYLSHMADDTRENLNISDYNNIVELHDGDDLVF